MTNTATPKEFESLADLMERGMKAHDKIKGTYFRYKGPYAQSQHKPNGSCALGAVYWAATGSYAAYASTVSDVVRERCGIDLMRVKDTHPVTGESKDIYAIITELNDDHDWSRSRIAAWIRRREAFLREESRKREGGA